MPKKEQKVASKQIKTNILFYIRMCVTSVKEIILLYSTCPNPHAVTLGLPPVPPVPFSFEPQPHSPGPPTNMSSHSTKVICLARHNSKLMHLQLRDCKHIWKMCPGMFWP